ncbi:type II secretion system inner membrane protein GspF [Thiomicrorhabdus aquaedulcis]|uniref:type II secretion system inner membrane protein GspF n=1 Tax=Thiomicrorhabdus aquaedulcis TaxID=2211106 RepID=UPI000FD8AB39|nr:type II secretion system inner membrane protein GspF [Thiomicrorhabdus aquaedulcis]
MAVFEYRALTQQGQTTKGVLEGDGERQIRQMLRDQGLSPIEIRALDGSKKSAGQASGRAQQTHQAWFGAKIKVDELALFTRELYTLLDAGIPLNQALKSLAGQAESKTLTRFLSSLHTRVSEGYSLATAMEMAPAKVSHDIIATIQAGEESGHLDKVLSRLADAVEQRDQLNKKMKTALIYPALMVVVAVLIVFFLMVYVVPKVVSVFDNMQQALPPLTQGLLSVSEFVQNQWPLMLVAAVALWLWSIWLMRQAKWRFKVHTLMMNAPGLKRFLIYAATARWARTLGVLLSSGVPIKDALTISAEVMTLDPMKQAVLKMVTQVREGKTVGTAMTDAGFFPPLLLNLVKTGEGKGQLDNMLLKGAKHYELSVETAAATLVSILEPMLIIIMGGVVLTIVLAIMMPIFEMNQMVG